MGARRTVTPGVGDLDAQDGPDGDSCVEIAVAPRTVHVRDSKNVEGPRFTVTPAAWTGFVDQLGEA
ncbi:DUF397 domain-containing protein [Streptomyces sp. NPDC051572]|uniref:DUF397 domain-containing protein n=1 Tax=Streptomyces sp. NPDC051572 TaxID=3155802 RepID=UPI00344ED824